MKKNASVTSTPVIFTYSSISLINHIITKYFKIIYINIRSEASASKFLYTEIWNTVVTYLKLYKIAKHINAT